MSKLFWSLEKEHHFATCDTFVSRCHFGVWMFSTLENQRWPAQSIDFCFRVCISEWRRNPFVTSGKARLCSTTINCGVLQINEFKTQFQIDNALVYRTTRDRVSQPRELRDPRSSQPSLPCVKTAGHDILREGTEKHFANGRMRDFLNNCLHFLASDTNHL